MAKYLKRDYPDLNEVRVLVIGRGSPMNPDRYLYKNPDRPSSFNTALYAMLGVENFEEFKKAFVLTDAMRCHVQYENVPERALSFCARHLRDELKHFPNLQTVVILGRHAYRQFQSDVLERRGAEIRPFAELLKPQGWAQEVVPFPHLKSGTLRVIYSRHPSDSHQNSPSIAPALPPLTP